MAHERMARYGASMFICDVRDGVDRADMMAWLTYVGVTAPMQQMFQTPHPFVPHGNLLQIVECIITPYATLAVEFAEQFGRNVFTEKAPYTPDLTDIPQTGLFERRR